MEDSVLNHGSFETFPTMIITIDLNCKIVNCNAMVVTFLGYTKEELLQRSIESFLNNESENRFWLYLEQALSGTFDVFKTNIIKKNGMMLPICFTLFPIYEGSEIKGAHCMVLRETDQQNSQDTIIEAMIHELNTIRFAFDQSADVAITDAYGNMIYINDRLCKVTQYEQHELLGKNFLFLNYKHHSQQFFKELWETISAGKVWHGEIRNRKKDGSYYWLDSTIVPVLDGTGRPYQYITIGYNITDRKELEGKVQFQTNFDSLTLLPNRWMLEELIEEEIKLTNINGKFALYMLNLNRFKFINEMLGHQTGDRVLRAVAQRMKRMAAKYDGKAGHFSGDQFYILVSNVNEDERVTMVADALVDLFKEPFVIQDYQLYITANIGIAVFPECGDNNQALLKNVEIALHRSRETKRGSYEIYSSVLDMHVNKQFSLMNDSYNVFKRGEFVLYFQPIIDLKTDGQIGAEALIRWDHSGQTIISPDEFIPFSEETGLIVSITEWVIREVCKQLSQWQKEGIKPIQISVNLSAHDLMRRDLISVIKKALQEYKINPELLQLEITERLVARNDEQVVCTLKQLKDLGVKIALDDFGTGYSSLHLLKTLPIDTVKIDKNFVADLCENSPSKKLLSSLVQFVRELELVSVVEGVETEEQLEELVKFKCDKVQGFLISHPVPESEFKSKFLNAKYMLVRRSATIPQEKKQEQPQKNPDKNRRRFFRIDLEYPLGGRMTIKTADGRKVNIGENGKSRILIINIGPGGLRFLSKLQLPIDPNMIFEFETKLFGKVLMKKGYVAWGNQYSDSIYEYGMELIINEGEQSELVKLLNSLIVKLRQNPLVKECEFVTDDFLKYLSGE